MSSETKTNEFTFEQALKVVSPEYTGDESGREWRVHYVLYRTHDDDGRECFDLYDDDGAGNGTQIARGYHQRRMVSLTLRLGEFVEWAMPTCPADGNGLADDGVCGFCGNSPEAYQ